MAFRAEDWPLEIRIFEGAKCEIPFEKVMHTALRFPPEDRRSVALPPLASTWCVRAGRDGALLCRLHVLGAVREEEGAAWRGVLWEEVELAHAPTLALRGACRREIAGYHWDKTNVHARFQSVMHEGWTTLTWNRTTEKGTLGSTPVRVEAQAEHLCLACGELEHHDALERTCAFCGRCTPKLHEGEEHRSFAGEPSPNHNKAGRLGSTVLSVSSHHRHSKLVRLNQQVQQCGEYKDSRVAQACSTMMHLQGQLHLAHAVVAQARQWFEVLRHSSERLAHHGAMTAACLIAALWEQRAAQSAYDVQLGRYATCGSYAAWVNGSGQLHRVVAGGVLRPLAMPAGVRVRQVAVGTAHLSALDTHGRAWALGTNASGCLGVRDARERAALVPVAMAASGAPTAGWVWVVAGDAHTAWQHTTRAQVWAAGAVAGSEAPVELRQPVAGAARGLAAGAAHVAVRAGAWHAAAGAATSPQWRPAPGHDDDVVAAAAVGAYGDATAWVTARGDVVVRGGDVDALPAWLPLTPGRWWLRAGRHVVPEAPPQTGGRGGLEWAASLAPRAAPFRSELPVQAAPAASLISVVAQRLRVVRHFPPTHAIATATPPRPRDDEAASEPRTLHVLLKAWLRHRDALPLPLRELVLGLSRAGAYAHCTRELTRLGEVLGTPATTLVALLRALWKAGVVDWVQGYWMLAPGLTRAHFQSPSVSQLSRPEDAAVQKLFAMSSPPTLVLPAGWIQRTHPETRQLLFWQLPQARAGFRHPPHEPLPEGWVMVAAASRRVLYHHLPTGRWQRQPPYPCWQIPIPWRQEVDDAGLRCWTDARTGVTQTQPPTLVPQHMPDETSDPFLWLHQTACTFAYDPSPVDAPAATLETTVRQLVTRKRPFEALAVPIIAAPVVGGEPLSSEADDDDAWDAEVNVHNVQWCTANVLHKYWVPPPGAWRPAVTLKPSTTLHPHQMEALSKILTTRGQLVSGYQVIPCGGGKSLVGIALCTQVPPPVLVLCHNLMSAAQWQSQFERWATPARVHMVAPGTPHIQSIEGAQVVLTTFKMLSGTNGTSRSTQQWLLKRRWNAVIYDEVHGAAAELVELNVVSKLLVGVHLGMTATALREDDRIAVLDQYIGPCLHHIGWQELTRQGHLTPLTCVEIKCPYPEPWKQADDRARDDDMARRLLSAMNPTKFAACCRLLNRHRGESILLFFEELQAMHWYARHLALPYISGSTSHRTKEQLLQAFQERRITVLAFSRAGDTSIDIPALTVVIQVAGHGACRRQEVQRAGRCTRPARGKKQAWFYTLTTCGTREEKDTHRRQSYLRSEGYTYDVEHEPVAVEWADSPHTALAQSPNMEARPGGACNGGKHLAAQPSRARSRGGRTLRERLRGKSRGKSTRRS